MKRNIINRRIFIFIFFSTNLLFNTSWASESETTINSDTEMSPSEQFKDCKFEQPDEFILLEALYLFDDKENKIFNDDKLESELSKTIDACVNYEIYVDDNKRYTKPDIENKNIKLSKKLLDEKIYKLSIVEKKLEKVIVNRNEIIEVKKAEEDNEVTKKEIKELEQDLEFLNNFLSSVQLAINDSLGKKNISVLPSENYKRCKFEDSDNIEFPDLLFLQNKENEKYKEYNKTVDVINACVNFEVYIDNNQNRYIEPDTQNNKIQLSKTLLDKKIIILSSTKEKLEELISKISEVQTEGENNKNLFKSEKNDLDLILDSVSSSLLDLYEEKDPTRNKTKLQLSDEDNFRSCKIGLSGLSDDPAEAIKDMENYLNGCKTAFNYAIQTNDKEALESLRKATSESIETIDGSLILWFRNGDQTGNNLGSNFIKAKDIIDELRLLSGDLSKLPLIANWQNKPFTYQFYVGFDFNKVDKIDTSQNPRVGLQLYFRPGRQLDKVREKYPDCRTTAKLCGDWGLHFPHSFLSIKNTTSAEQSTPETSDATDWEGGIYLPLYIGRRGIDGKNMTEFMIGPVWLRGARNLDDSIGSLDRKYWGARLAFNEEMYFDLLRGNSEGADSRRYGLRGQFPVSELGNGRLFFGIDINFSSYGKDSDDSNDSTNFYLMWQTGFDDLWSSSSSR